MATIEQRFKEIAYSPKLNYLGSGERIPRSKDIVFMICRELHEDDFPKLFFNSRISLGEGFKFLTYCGKDQKKNLNKNALVIQKKLKKKGKVIYRVYLMDPEGFNIRELFLKYSGHDSIGEHNGFNLSPRYYLGSIREEYTKQKLVFTLNKIIGELVDWGLAQK